MNYFTSKWKDVRSATSEVDLTFLVLRIVCLAGGLFWLLVVPLSPPEQVILMNALANQYVESPPSPENRNCHGLLERLEPRF